jgi:O-antigen ligase
VGDSPRQKIRNFSYYVFKIDPVLGIGIGNFENFGHDDIKELVIKDKGVYDKSVFMPYAHPHNVYLTYLTGGGILLFSVFVWFWLQIVNIIYRVNKRSNEKWLVFSSASVVMVVLGIGWVNTTLAHEHALITMFVLGVLISLDRKIHA